MRLKALRDRSRSSKRVIQVALLVLLAATTGASATSLTFAPNPALAGEPITVTYKGVSNGCRFSQVFSETIRGSGILLLHVRESQCHFPTHAPFRFAVSTTVAPLAAGDYEVQVAHAPYGTREVAQLRVLAQPACRASEQRLCLGNGRFEVSATWTDFLANQGLGRVVPQKSLEFGALWFFSPENPELLAKVLDGCALNRHYWVFLSPATTVAYTVTVRDVVRGMERTYAHGFGAEPELTADTSAFACQ